MPSKNGKGWKKTRQHMDVRHMSSSSTGRMLMAAAANSRKEELMLDFNMMERGFFDRPQYVDDQMELVRELNHDDNSRFRLLPDIVIMRVCKAIFDRDFYVKEDMLPLPSAWLANIPHHAALNSIERVLHLSKPLSLVVVELSVGMSSPDVGHQDGSVSIPIKIKLNSAEFSFYPRMGTQNDGFFCGPSTLDSTGWKHPSSYEKMTFVPGCNVLHRLRVVLRPVGTNRVIFFNDHGNEDRSAFTHCAVNCLTDWDSDGYRNMFSTGNLAIRAVGPSIAFGDISVYVEFE